MTPMFLCLEGRTAKNVLEGQRILSVAAGILPASDRSFPAASGDASTKGAEVL